MQQLVARNERDMDKKVTA